VFNSGLGLIFSVFRHDHCVVFFVASVPLCAPVDARLLGIVTVLQVFLSGPGGPRSGISPLRQDRLAVFYRVSFSGFVSSLMPLFALQVSISSDDAACPSFRAFFVSSGFDTIHWSGMRFFPPPLSRTLAERVVRFLDLINRVFPFPVARALFP